MTCQVTSQCFQWLYCVGTYVMTSTRTDRARDGELMEPSPHGNYGRSLARYYSWAASTASFVGAYAMRDDAWRHLDDEALERLLIERWLRRGATLVVILLAAIAATWFGIRGV